MKTPITILSTLAAVSLGLVAAGCGGDDSTATSAGGAGTTPARQAAAGDGSPGPAPCAKTTYRDGFSGGDIYISCIDQPIRVWASDVDNYDFVYGRYPDEINGPNRSRTGPGTILPPSSHLTSTFNCATQPRSVGWKMGLTFADGSKASVRVQLPVKGWWDGRPVICNELAGEPGFWAEFNTPEGKGLRDVVLTSNTGKRVRLVAKKNIDMPDWTNPGGYVLRYRPIFIQSVLKK